MAIELYLQAVVGAIGLDPFKRELEQVDGFRLLGQSLESGVQIVAIVEESSAVPSARAAMAPSVIKLVVRL